MTDPRYGACHTTSHRILYHWIKLVLLELLEEFIDDGAAADAPSKPWQMGLRGVGL
jgi:hypothetical protein